MSILDILDKYEKENKEFDNFEDFHLIEFLTAYAYGLIKNITFEVIYQPEDEDLNEGSSELYFLQFYKQNIMEACLYELSRYAFFQLLICCVNHKLDVKITGNVSNKFLEKGIEQTQLLMEHNLRIIKGGKNE